MTALPAAPNRRAIIIATMMSAGLNPSLLLFVIHLIRLDFILVGGAQDSQCTSAEVNPRGLLCSARFAFQLLCSGRIRLDRRPRCLRRLCSCPM